MGIYNESKTTRTGRYGLPVNRASETLPQDGSSPLFSVIGGRIAITQVIGEVVVVIESISNAVKLQFSPTGGTSVDLCSTLDINGDEVGTLYGIAGSPPALVDSSSVINPQESDIIVNEGTIDLVCAEEVTGEIKWTIYYIAMDDGAYIEAAEEDGTTTTPGP